MDVSRSIDALGDRIAAEVARADAWISSWLELVAEFDELEAASDFGFRSTSEWLAWRCSLVARTARDHVRVARRLQELPLIRAAFAARELSYSQVRALTRAYADEARLLELARGCTVAQLERAIRALRGAPSADPDVAEAARERRRVDWTWNGDGTLRVRAELPPDDGAALIEAIETGAEMLHGDGATGRPRLPARRADALAEIMRSGCPRTQVILHVDDAALACRARGGEARAGSVCSLEDGPAIPPEMARRLTCDAAVVRDGGHRIRTVTPGLRRRLESRDQRCRFPGCVRRHGLHAHHIDHWVHGGPTDQDNLVLLCHFHHRLVHEGGFTIDRFFVVRRPDGQVIPEIAERAPPIAA